MPDWIQKYWVQIVFVLGAISAAIKNHVDTSQVKNAVFNHSGEIRLISKDDCMECQKRRDEKDNDRKRELQNIHESISTIQKTMADMPQRIAEHLKTMGHLK